MTTKTRLSEVPKYKEDIISFFKFTKHIDSLVQGNLYMNNLKCYIDMEKESGVKGVGDLLEASQVYSNVDIRMYNNETGELALSGMRGNINFRVDGIEKTPVYCLFALTSDKLKIVEETEDSYITKMDFSADEIDKMVNEFGESVVLINAKQFIERVMNVFDEKGYGYKLDLVKYDDYSVNSSKRIESYMKNNNEIFFWKDKFFENQNEYRVVITNLETDEPITVNIGDISDITEVYNAREVFNGFKIHFKK
ncbi:hypothetical protein [Gottfriedia acidiceleris]|uniref:hypothetical protein n=1 Tax=Gottfriedia acidiceleris TaxID=371036 RepID=UPI003D19D38F